MKNIVVFDFDGTIANTIPVTISILKQFYFEEYHSHVDDKLIEELRDKSIPEMFKIFKISLIKLPLIASKTIRAMNREIAHMKPIDGMKDLLFQLKEQGRTLGIVSSNSSESIKKFLKVNDLEIFDFIYTNSRVFGKSSSLKRLFKKYNASPEDIVYIGDEVRDIEAARKVGIKILSVLWGVNTRAKLESYSPDYIAAKPPDILSYFKSEHN